MANKLQIKEVFQLTVDKVASPEQMKALQAELNEFPDGYNVVGKARPWEESDDEYIVYSDGDLFLIRAREDNTIETEEQANG